MAVSHERPVVRIVVLNPKDSLGPPIPSGNEFPGNLRDVPVLRDDDNPLMLELKRMQEQEGGVKSFAFGPVVHNDARIVKYARGSGLNYDQAKRRMEREERWFLIKSFISLHVLPMLLIGLTTVTIMWLILGNSSEKFTEITTWLKSFGLF